LSRSHDVVHKIIEPVINNTDCLNIIVSKTNYFAKIINNAGDDATGIRKQINEIIKTSENNELINFAKEINQE
jgi:hypothetical protein